MRNEKEDVLRTLREIEKQAAALARALPAGLPLHRARLIHTTAAHLALQVELESAGGHLLNRANDAARVENLNPA